jgi:hypothetical protein
MVSDDHRVTGLEAAWERGGRPSLYDPSFCTLVRRLALLGMPCTMKDLALFFGVARSTIYLWKSQFPEFSDAIEAGRLRADSLVAERLFERAVGFEYIEQQAVKVKRIEYHENGKKALETEEIKVVEVRRVLPPDTAAAKYWLKNRHPDLWGEKPVIAVVDDSYVPPEDRPRTLAEIDAERKSEWAHFDLTAGKTKNAKADR